MEIEHKPRRLRIITGPVEVIEEQLNLLIDDYSVLVWHFAAVGERMHSTVVLLSVSEIRKMQLAQAPMMGRRN